MTRAFVHPDGRRWHGRTLGRLFQLVLRLPDDDEPIVRTQRQGTPADAQRKLAEAIVELLAEGFRDTGSAPWPLPEPRAGALIVAKSDGFQPQWIVAALEAVLPSLGLPHGANYTHRFVSVPIRGGITACYYEITGYSTRGECAAFEDALFSIDRFAARLAIASAPPRFLSVSDVGFDDDGYAVTGFDEGGRPIADVAGALLELGCSLADLREARQRLDEVGATIWKLP